MVLPLKNLVKIKTSDKVGEGGGLKKKILALRDLVWANNKEERGGPGPPGPSRGFATVLIRVGQCFWVYGKQGLFKSGIRHIAA